MPWFCHILPWGPDSNILQLCSSIKHQFQLWHSLKMYSFKMSTHIQNRIYIISLLDYSINLHLPSFTIFSPGSFISLFFPSPCLFSVTTVASSISEYFPTQNINLIWNYDLQTIRRLRILRHPKLSHRLEDGWTGKEIILTRTTKTRTVSIPFFQVKTGC